MEVTIRKTRKIPPFAITVAELEELHGKLTAEFHNNGEIRTTISIEIPAEEKEYRFESFEDLRENYQFEKGVTEFSIRMECGDYSLDIDKEWIALGARQAEVSATSPRLAWCIGINEEVVQYLKKHYVWYHWILRSPVVELGLIITVLSISILFSYFIPSEWRLDFLALPVGLMGGIVLANLRPRKMATATLKKEQTKVRISWLDLVTKIVIPLVAIGMTAATYILKK